MQPDRTTALELALANDELGLKTQPLSVLRPLFAETTGEATRAPNRTFLARKIIGALADPAVRARFAPEEAADEQPELAEGEVAPDEVAARRYVAGELKPRQMTVPQLQIAYRLAVGRDTGSADPGYLVWKIREAQKGNVTVGAIKRPRASGPIKVLPLRLPASASDAMDAAIARLGFTSRMDFLRDAIASSLQGRGETEAAAAVRG